MRYAVFGGKKTIATAEGPMPVAGPGEVALDVYGCALCGSELRVWRDGWKTTPGHEIAGVVDAPGHRLHAKRAVVYIPIWCGKCERCRAGDTHLCTHGSGLVGWQTNGGYAERVVVPEQCVLPIPDDVPMELAPLLLDTIGTPAHGIRLAKRVVRAGPAAVIGAGPIGLGAVLALPKLGFPDVAIAEPRAGRRGFALELGSRELPDAGPLFPLVLETAGVDAARQRALELTAPGGVCVFLGESETWRIAETKAIRRKDFFILRSFYFPLSEFDDNVALLRADLDRYRRLVDARVPLEGLGDLFARFAAGEALKPQLAPRG